MVAGTGLFTKYGGTLNNANPPKEAVSSSVSNEPVAMEMQSPVVDKSNAVDSDVGSYPPLPTEGTTPAGNTPAKSSYANVTRKPSGEKLNIHTFFTPGGNGIDVVVLVEFIRTISDRFANTEYGFFLGSRVAYPVHPDENLMKEDVRTVPVWVKLHGVPVMAFSDDGLSAIATKLGTPLMLESYTSDMYNIVVAMLRIMGEGHYTCNVRVEYEWKPPRCSSCKVFGHIHEECSKNTGADEKKTIKKPSQISRGVPVGPEMGFKPQKEYRHVPKKPNPSSSGIVESDSEVEVVFDETTNLRISTSGKDGSDKGYGTNILLEQWRDSYPDNDHYDPYDDDMYENHDLSEHLQSICDDLDITVHDRKKK
ncbi:kinase-like domain, phloem protein 2-like protein [Tanacetum coccineum]|uniref:Kinase-like domain, phloem protein 2-like protein n=1 Tax=Tanacetum coccineum TaxID=301880 RepID=A0ABQ5CM13_9ASTR